MVMSYQSGPLEPVDHPYPVAESFMARSYVTVTPEMDVYDAMDLLVRYGTTCAIVVDDTDRLVGIISERDCLKLVNVVLYSSNSAALHCPVYEYMTQEVRSVAPSTGLTEVAELFLQLPYKKLPVVADGKVVGLVHRHTVLTVLQEFHHGRMRNRRERTRTRVRARQA